jgi:hypothetical protein
MLDIPDLKVIATEIVNQLTAEGPKATKRAKIKLAKASGKESKAMTAMMKYALPGQSLEQGKWFLQITGPAGLGKTYDTRVFGKTMGFDHHIEVQCLSDMDPRDFIAGVGVDDIGKLTPVDGPLARGWRAAAKGEQVLIILDEMSNIPTKSKQAFQTATSPDMDGNLVLHTGRVVKAKAPPPSGVPCTVKTDEDGYILKGEPGYFDPYLEQIIAPMANISIVGTANAGSKYQVAPNTPAIKARFKPIYVDTDVASIKKIIGDALREKGWKVSISSKFTNLFRQARKAQEKMLLDGCPAIREFLHAIYAVQDDPATGKAPEDAIVAIREVLLEPGFDTWFVAEDHDGVPMVDQVRTWKDIVTSTFVA